MVICISLALLLNGLLGFLGLAFVFVLFCFLTFLHILDINTVRCSSFSQVFFSAFHRLSLVNLSIFLNIFLLYVGILF